MQPQHEFFWNGRRSARWIVLKFCITNRTPFAQLLAKNISPGMAKVTELWRHELNNLRPTCHRNRVFSYVTFWLWLEWRHYAWFRSEHDHTWPLTLNLDLSNFIQGHWPWPTHTYLQWLNLFFFWGGVLRFRDQICGWLLKYTCFIGLFTVPDVNQWLSLSLPSYDFPGEGGVVPFRDDIHDKYFINIPKQYVILLWMDKFHVVGFLAEN